MSGSRSIAWTMPSERACEYLIERIVSDDVLEQRCSGRPGALLGLGQDVVDFLVDLELPGVKVVLRGDAGREQALAASFHRALFHPGFDFLLAAVGAVRLVV